MRKKQRDSSRSSNYNNNSLDHVKQGTIADSYSRQGGMGAGASMAMGMMTSEELTIFSIFFLVGSSVYDCGYGGDVIPASTEFSSGDFNGGDFGGGDFGSGF
ncbi:hypothetical protein BGZ99_007662 [Dissophora globulifera]|uniref:Uncharacterized protein n=1 Tax=Dissophora globulifera TaxID=979702 RepID=A0A9P6RCW0_9FUNG|nr:hypothetical protein BGZ99_007662 [Dissophora globulifera]